ncbi:RICIN domain-containing protein [Streptomyces canus]|uniref:RICIN domain-containing protein n=1 Tax=Streptomyces canus TaxID=58343 RepID=UPI0030E149FB
MHTTRAKAMFAAALAGTLMAVASPATANAQSPQSGDPTPSSVQAGEAWMLLNANGKVLQPVSSANGARVVQRTRASGSNTQYWFDILDEPYWSFENFSSGLNLGIDGASKAAGANAITANGSSDHNQDWIKDTSIYVGGVFRLKNRNSGLCLGISGGSTADGAQAAQFPCDTSANQRWSLTH